jgi:hypothetical protein
VALLRDQSPDPVHGGHELRVASELRGARPRDVDADRLAAAAGPRPAGEDQVRPEGAARDGDDVADARRRRVQLAHHHAGQSGAERRPDATAWSDEFRYEERSSWADVLVRYRWRRRPVLGSWARTNSTNLDAGKETSA